MFTMAPSNNNTNTNAAPAAAKRGGGGGKRKASAGSRCSKKNDSDMANAPIFLRKTYTMIDSCNPDIASWSEDGLSFLVKDTDRFAAEIIPEYFKHSNFSSFVRQLNFYGFRKIKSDTIRIKEESAEESKYWRFRHPQFQRGRPDLLCEIKKAHTSSDIEKEVESLKNEVHDLKGQLAYATGEIKNLKKFVEQLVGAQQHLHYQMNQQQQHEQHEQHHEPPLKKVKLEQYDPTASVPDGPVPSDYSATVKPNPVGSNIDVLGQPVVSDLILDGDKLDSIYPPGSIKPELPSRFESGTSNASLTPQDEQMLASIFALDFDDEVIDNKNIGVHDSSTSSNDTPTKKDIDPELVQKLKNSLSVLPPDIQENFVDSMVASVAEHQHPVSAPDKHPV